MSDEIRWGILATGKIAHTFARDLALVPDARLVAVGSRRLESAESFAAEHGGTAYGSYDELAADPDVDVIYIATPHAFHLDNARLCFEAGKDVLCEKPLTLDTADAEEMIRLAGVHGRFLMEAMWTACHPVIRELRTRLASGEFGTPRQLHAELGFRVDAGPDDRMLDPALGASALLDMGIYPLTFAHLMLGEAEQLTATAGLSDRGIDLDVAVAGRYPAGALATMTASMSSYSSRVAAIATSQGRIHLDNFHHPSKAVFTPYVEGPGSWVVEPGQPVEVLGEEPVIGQGYGNEIAEVGRCLRAGLRESPLVPHAQTLTLLRQMDAIREQVGVTFPG
jgi:predicted dehydrogenase